MVPGGDLVEIARQRTGHISIIRIFKGSLSFSGLKNSEFFLLSSTGA